MAPAMCRHFGPVAAPLHRAPAPVARSRRVDKGDPAVDAFAAFDSGSQRTGRNLDRITRDRREQGGGSGRGRPRSRPAGLESRREAGRCSERVERGTVRGAYGPAVDDCIGGTPDRRPQALRLRDTRGGCSDPDRTEDLTRPSLQILRLVEHLESFAVERVAGDRERKGQAARIEPEHLAVGMVESEDAAVQHLTTITGYRRGRPLRVEAERSTASSCTSAQRPPSARSGRSPNGIAVGVRSGGHIHPSPLRNAHVPDRRCAAEHDEPIMCAQGEVRRLA